MKRIISTVIGLAVMLSSTITASAFELIELYYNGSLDNIIQVQPNIPTTNPIITQNSNRIVLKNVEANPSKFDPYDDEETEIQFKLREKARVSVKVYDESWDYITSLARNKNLGAGTHDYEWDGLDNNDDIVDDDTYYVKVIAKTTDGYEEDSYIEVDVKEGSSHSTVEPRLQDVFVSKKSFDPGRNEVTFFGFTVTAESDIEVSVYDGGNKIREIYYKKDYDEGTYVIAWDGKDDEGNKVKEDENYKIKIAVENDEGSDNASATVRVEDDSEYSTKHPNIYNDTTHPIAYTPDEEDYMEFAFKTSKDAYATVMIYDDGEKIAEVFEGNVDQGKSEIKWYGNDEDGNQITDGVYDYKIIAENTAGDSTEWGKFMVVDGYKNNYSKKCGGFTDIYEDDDYCEAVKWAADEGIFEGYDDGSFQSYRGISRTEALKVVLEALDYKIYDSDGSSLGFSDVNKNQWYMRYIRSGMRQGIVEGFKDGSFRPNKQVSKSEAIKMVVNAARIAIPTCTEAPYFDVPMFKWFTNEACFVKDFELTDDEYWFNPKGLYTRGEMAELLYNFYKEGLLAK
ncbi:hypothetical protein HOE67_01675 [Candidatus Peregrinibacteria bacterium]|jgi:flagellar hook assembly protein FlgD|nr:hypothetical protein [Candidatus Peregrinibacteria bacterium]MBT4055796.1 hypothetical protein [Candidatus Peregrinibacteria bacterium]